MLLDETDRKILSLLKEDSRMQFAEIGKKVNLSAPAVHARVKKMEAAKIIQGYSIAIDPVAVNSGLCAFVRIAINKGTSSGLAKDLKKFKQIEECHGVAGEDCVMVKLRVGTTLELSRLIDQIRGIENIERTLTVVVLETHFERGLQPA
ncbi:Lrp/AsnC family transcriptional regulator [Bdellovibrio sp. KM01]|uniref:Lrp/AsnC family transcriptional regulator n=1 Tax=Bdellovibrio sp. KM01 TaxID=2748865 RepID=UPI0015E9C592|nr:Lrp/AsnC family transcriptional regulator [Bdellovibrio sp. KM01]QLY24239.1 Lrp/AsnC family transcriptional regulator [Bdellovibrio sp. KM01]